MNLAENERQTEHLAQSPLERNELTEHSPTHSVANLTLLLKICVLDDKTHDLCQN